MLVFWTKWWFNHKFIVTLCNLLHSAVASQIMAKYGWKDGQGNTFLFLLCIGKHLLPLYLLAANMWTWTVFSLRLLEQPRSQGTAIRGLWEQDCWQPRSQGFSSYCPQGAVRWATLGMRLACCECSVLSLEGGRWLAFQEMLLWFFSRFSKLKLREMYASQIEQLIL